MKDLLEWKPVVPQEVSAVYVGLLKLVCLSTHQDRGCVAYLCRCLREDAEASGVGWGETPVLLTSPGGVFRVLATLEMPLMGVPVLPLRVFTVKRPDSPFSYSSFSTNACVTVRVTHSASRFTPIPGLE